MRVLESCAVRRWLPGDGSSTGLASDVLALDALADQFHVWRGLSGARYVASVYEVDIERPDAGLPRFETFVLIPVVHKGPARRPLSIVAIERESDRRRAITAALAAGADEWHAHLIAPTREARSRAVADLLARHGQETSALSA